MSIESRSQQYGSIFGDWHIARILGTGSGGKSAVFELVRNNNGWKEYSALKVISLIEEFGSQNAMTPLRKNEYSTAVRERRHKADQEVRLMEQLRGKTNIVDYLDHQFFSWSDRNGFGVDLLIRMEKLTDLRSQLRRGKICTDQEIIKIGRDICQALIICHGKNILHRDIKPENIFFNNDGDYKLGDFGVSRIMSSAPSAVASTGIGTMAYCAPEQLSGAYDRRIDIYSLGLVLYELANGNHLPFARSGYADQEAIQTRLSGKPLPAPGGRNPGSRLVQVILKACAPRPENRYASAEEFMWALDSVSGKSGAYSTAPVAGKSFAAAEFTTNQLRQSQTVHSEYPTNLIDADTYGPEQETRLSFDDDEEGTPRRGAGFYLAIILPAVLGVVALIAVASMLLLKPSHTHSYLDATCENPRICAECGEIEGAALGHRWSSATCTEAQACLTCGKAAGSALGHSWADATCDAPKTCATCGLTSGEALEHTWTAATAIAPETCSLCGATNGRSLGLPLTWCESVSSSNAPDSNTDVATGDWEDNFGTLYANSLRFWVCERRNWSDTEHIEFDVNGAYKELSFTIAAERHSEPDAETRIQIYADNVLVYESTAIANSTSPLRDTIDITGVSRIRIICTTDSDAFCYCIVDAVLYC